MNKEFSAIDRFICEMNNFESVEHKYQYGDMSTYVPRFIEECVWTCNRDHMVGKWHESVRRASEDCALAFIIFYCEMDTANKESMVAWIMENRKTGYVREKKQKLLTRWLNAIKKLFKK